MVTDRRAADSPDAEGEGGAYEDYFAEINDACGCAEIWEYLSERRRGSSARRD